METLNDLGEFEAEAARFATSLVPTTEGATFVTLSGELGAGKTAFSKAVAKVLGVEEAVTSPTFVLEKIYDLGAESAFKKLVHIDAYRLESGSDLAPLGLEELLKEPKNLILLEWPEKVADALPEPTVKISFIAHVNGSRTITYG